MTLLPANLDLVASESAAFAQLRGVTGYSQSWAGLAAHAQLVMTHYQELDREDALGLYDISKAEPLVAASRILDSLSLAQSNISANERQDWSLLALLAYGMWGNFLSAAAMKTRLTTETLSRPITAAIVATCAPQVADKCQDAILASRTATNYIKGLLKFLQTGDHTDAEYLEVLLMKCMTEADSFESAMLRSARIALWHVEELSILKNIKSRFPNTEVDYGKGLFSSGVRVLLPPQYTALNRSGLVNESWNSFVGLHTSAGKTLLGEMCLLGALDSGPGLSVYLAPYVALGRQVADGFRRHLPSSIRVHTLVGGFRADAALDPENQRELVVATPERIDAILRKSRELMKYLRCIVVDEAHHIGNGIRGARLEGILARIRMSQSTPRECRIVLLSAVVHEYARLKRWLSIPDEGVVTDDWRPTACRLGMWERDGKVRWFRGADVVRRTHTENSEIVGTQLIPWPNVTFYAPKHFGAKKKQLPMAMENVAYFADYLWNEFHDVCLCICMSKNTSRQLAWTIANRFPSLEPIPKLLAQTRELIDSSYPHLRLLAFCCSRGVAYHNASLPHEVRRKLEEAVTQSELKVVTATTTLAEGVDLPFRTTIVVDWLSWQGEQERPMSPLLFRSIAGRCGRAGRQTEGDTIIFDNPIGDPRFTFDANRGDLIRAQFIEDTNLEISSVFEQARAGTEYFHDLQSAIASQFLAAIPENPEEESLVETFASSLYWSMASDQSPKAKATVKEIADSILSESEGALAFAASPIQLTTVGRAAVASGFSPESCREIMRVLKGAKPSDNAVNLVSHLLVEVGHLREQSVYAWRKEVEKPHRGCRIKVSDTSIVVKGWLAGDSLLDIFLRLPSVKKSKSKVSVNDWLDGLGDPVVWDDEFDTFVEWVNSVIVSFGSWLLRACAELSFEASGWTTDMEWKLLAEYCEHGVDTLWAVDAMRQNAPAGREVLAVLGREIFGSESASTDTIANGELVNVDIDTPSTEQIEQQLRELFEEGSDRYTSALKVVDWWQNQNVTGDT